jgi:putative two-component system response regulator
MSQDAVEKRPAVLVVEGAPEDLAAVERAIEGLYEVDKVENHLILKSAAEGAQSLGDGGELDASRIQEVTMMAMGSLAEARDNETGNHIRRTQQYIRDLVEKLKEVPRFSAALSDKVKSELIIKSAPLHDIGKVGIPDRILLKPGKLTPDEFEIMKTHTTIGRDAILTAERLVPTPSSFLRFAREIIYSHHEKWDGTGYPRRLKGEMIPLSARIMAVADVYDALISHRPYRPPFPHEKAVEVLLAGKGTSFDPDIVDAFMDIQDKCHATALKFADSEEAVHTAYDLKNTF